MSRVPELRRTLLNAAPVARGDYVLYWMTAARRTRHSFALDRAVELAVELQRPLVVLEALRLDYRWASRRLHAFVIEGMADNRERLQSAGVRHHAYVEPAPGAGRGLLAAWAERAAVVITDEQRGFFQPRMAARAAERLGVRVESVDGVGLLPLRAADRAFARAVDFRRFLQRTLATHLEETPAVDPLRGLRALPRLERIPAHILERWPDASPELLAGRLDALSRLPVDPSVEKVELRGGARAGHRRLEEFVRARLPHYAERKHPDRHASSGLSPHLHFGHVGAHEVFAAVTAAEDWTPAALSPRASGQKEHFWGMSAPAEAFLDELLTWRELGHNFCAFRDDFDRYESLPGWALDTLARHANDPRPHLYRLEELEAARSHDPVWNAAQRELTSEGVLHNYLRMLWGKKILEWSASPREAISIMIELNNKYALDGRDPSSYSGIFWCLGRYDRPWAPERPIFGVIRYMSSDATLKKLRMKEYLARHAGEDRQRSLGF